MVNNAKKKKAKLAKMEKDKGQEGIFFEPVKFDEQERKIKECEQYLQTKIGKTVDK